MQIFYYFWDRPWFHNYTEKVLGKRNRFSCKLQQIFAWAQLDYGVIYEKAYNESYHSKLNRIDIIQWPLTLKLKTYSSFISFTFLYSTLFFFFSFS